MKALMIATSGIAIALLAGCGGGTRTEPITGTNNTMEADISFVNSVNDTAVNNGIISQHTIYPYHFISGGSELNSLGRKEVAVLADHYRMNKGHLTVRKGDASDELYNARLKSIEAELHRSGVEGSQVTLEDGMPGGNGMKSHALNAMLQAESMQSGKGADYSTSAPQLSGAGSSVVGGGK